MASGKASSSNSGQGAEEHTLADITDVEEIFSDTSSESENEDDVPLIAGAGQRKHGDLDDQTRASRRLANARLDEHFAILHSVLPRTARRTRTRTDSSIMMLANQHAMKLHRSVADLRYLTDIASVMNSAPANPLNRASSRGIPFGMKLPRMSSIDDITHENPMVELERDPLYGKLQLYIACKHRSSVLNDILAAIDLKGLSMLNGSVVCQENVLFANLSLEKENLVASDAGPEPRPEPLPESEEDEALKESLLCVIRQDTSGDGPEPLPEGKEEVAPKESVLCVTRQDTASDNNSN